ncbi:MAG TPA: YdcF family protein [Alphaproteobacteria bacterium]
MPACFVIFGAKLRPDGSPGPALRRRVAAALEAARGIPDAVFLVTGGQPRAYRTEATVMLRLLEEAGIPRERIIVEDKAANTRASAYLCAAILRARGDLTPVLVCSDRFHLPRCVWLLRLAGVRAAAARVPDERSQMRPALWGLCVAREIVAIVRDTIAMGLRRRG